MQRTASPRGSRTVGKAKPAAVIETLADLTPDPRNARRHNPRNVGMLEKALGEVGAARSIVIDERGVVLAGNATIEAAGRAGIERVQVVDADGETIIAVRRTGLTAKQKTRLALYDNRTAELADWDADVIADLLATERELLDGLFEKDELAKLIEGLDDDAKYTTKIEAPIYKVTGEKPPTIDLYNQERYQILLAEINNAVLPDEIKTFLSISATRHIVFNFSLIAEFYAHADKQTQGLMENSALVIIDFYKAIELGYVKLASDIEEQFRKEHPEDA